MTNYTEHNGLFIRDFLGAPTDAELQALEANLQTTLPDSFRAFLADANGGDLFGYALDIAHPEKPVSRCFSTLYGTKPRNPVNGFGHFDKELELSREAAELPPQVLPFARDDSGCEIYLDLTEEGGGRVVAFVLGIPGHEEQPEDNAWVTVALSFEDFLKKLRVDVEDMNIRLAQTVSEGDDAERARIIGFLDRAMPDWREHEEFAAHKSL